MEFRTSPRGSVVKAIEEDELDERKKSKKPARRGVTDPLPEDRLKPLEEVDDDGKPWDCPEGQQRSDETGECVGGDERELQEVDELEERRAGKDGQGQGSHGRGTGPEEVSESIIKTVKSFMQEKNRRLNNELTRRWAKK